MFVAVNMVLQSFRPNETIKHAAISRCVALLYLFHADEFSVDDKVMQYGWHKRTAHAQSTCVKRMWVKQAKKSPHTQRERHKNHFKIMIWATSKWFERHSSHNTLVCVGEWMGCIYAVLRLMRYRYNSIRSCRWRKQRQQTSNTEHVCFTARPHPPYIHICMLVSKNFSNPPEDSMNERKNIGHGFCELVELCGISIVQGENVHTWYKWFSNHFTMAVFPLPASYDFRSLTKNNTFTNKVRAHRTCLSTYRLQMQAVSCANFHWTLIFCVVYFDVICPAKGKKYHVLTPSEYILRKKLAKQRVGLYSRFSMLCVCLSEW